MRIILLIFIFCVLETELTAQLGISSNVLIVKLLEGENETNLKADPTVKS